MGTLTLKQKFLPIAEMPCLPVREPVSTYFSLER